MEVDQRSKKSAQLVGRLFPGVPDDFTLAYITPKLTWSSVRTLSCVSTSWREAVAGRQVYNERVGSQSTETLALLHHVCPGSRGTLADHGKDIHVLSVYSVRGKYRYDLPPIPFCEGGIPSACQHVSLDGNVYVLGGVMDSASNLGSREVHVLDVAGQGKWKPCARMQNARLDFGAIDLDGKIFVFGGSSLEDPVLVCEVYDPKVNAWSPIRPLQNGRVYHKVAKVGEEIVLYGGGVYVDRDDMGRHIVNAATVLDAYCPVKDEWRQIRPIITRFWDDVFMAQERYHMITRGGIYLYDTDLWHLRPFLDEPVCKFREVPHSSSLQNRALALGDEILYALAFEEQNGLIEFCLFQSKGFGSKKKTIELEKVDCHLFLDSRSSLAYAIQL